MKRLIIFLLISAFSATGAFALGIDSSIDGKIGGGYAPYTKRGGLTLSGNYQWVLDPFFSCGLETGFFWINWEEKRGQELVGQSNSDLKATTNAVVFPLMAIAQVRFPNLKDKINVIPFITVGLGYSLMPLVYSDPSYQDAYGVNHPARNLYRLFHGLTWEVFGGAAYSPSGSKIEFVGEFGYIGAHLYHGNNDINMSRFTLNAGVRFSLGKM
jgi:hypothetical protein